MNDLTAGVGQRAALTLTHRLAEHVAGARHEAIPAVSLDAAKLFMLDTLAVTWAGSDAPGCREAHALLADEGGRPDATAWVYGGRLPAAGAAFVNGMASAALDYDSLARDASVHVNVCVLPAALAMAERQRVSGKEFLTALTLGCDITCRLGAAAAVPHRGFHYTGIFGVFGATAAAARLLGLDATATRHALGLAYLQASGTMQANLEPSLAKRMLSAFSARSGVFVALLAQNGMTAPAQVLEGKLGLYALYQEGDPARLLDALGTRFDNTRLSLKKYPSCGCNHTALEGMLQLVRQHDLRPDDVQAVEVTISPYMERIVGGRYDPSGDAQVAAQFSMTYSVACALVRRKLGLAEIQADAARDPAINAHIHKVTLKVDPVLTSGRGPIHLRVQTKSRGELKLTVDHVPGSEEAPLTEDSIREKFDECFGLGVKPLSPAQTAEICARVRGIEKIADMSKFFDGIC